MFPVERIVPSMSILYAGVVVPNPMFPSDLAVNNVVGLVVRKDPFANTRSKRVLLFDEECSYRDNRNAAPTANASPAVPLRAKTNTSLGSFSMDVPIGEVLTITVLLVS